MTVSNVIGYTLLALPFAVMFGAGVKLVGLKFMLITYGALVLLVLSVAGGLYLAFGPIVPGGC